MVEEATGGGDVAHVAIHDEADGTRRIVTVPLNANEQKALAAHGDLIFGKPNPGKKIEDGDFIGLYDFFLEGYRETPRETLLSFLESRPDRERFEKLSTDELRRRVCREWVKGALTMRKAEKA